MGFVENFFVGSFGDNSAAATFLIALLPVIDLKGAIPFGSSEQLWADSALTIWQAFGISLIAVVLEAALLLAVLIPVFNLLKKSRVFGNTVCNIECRFKKRAERMTRSSETQGRSYVRRLSPQNRLLLGVFLVAAVPIPLTGIWASSAIAAFLHLPYFRALAAITLGTVASGLIIVGITILFGVYAIYIFHGMLVLALVALVVFAVLFSYPSPGRRLPKA